jgi:hypothetical protein
MPHTHQVQEKRGFLRCAPGTRRGLLHYTSQIEQRELEFQTMLLSGLHTWRKLIRSRFARNATQSRRKSLHKHLGRFDVAAMMEQLEDRTLLSNSSVLGASNEAVFNDNGDVDSVAFSVDGGGYLQQNLGGRFGFNSNSDLDSVTAGDQARLMSDMTSLSYIDSGKNDAVALGGNFTMAFAPADLSVDADYIIIEAFRSLTFVDGDINLTAARNIKMFSGSSITTVNGGITLSANASGTVTGDFNGVRLINGTIKTTGTGNLSLTGTGGDDVSIFSQYGVWIHDGSSVSSTSTGSSAGTITIDGTSDDGGGVRILDLTSIDGEIVISGLGGTGVNGINGVDLGVITSTGTGADAATITINGTARAQDADGVRLSADGSTVTSVSGDINITGTGGGGTGSGFFGNNPVRSTGTDKDFAATITINGTAGTKGDTGVQLIGANSTKPSLFTVAGDIHVVGQGGNGTGSDNRGVWLRNAYVVSTGTTKADAGQITIEGTGGSGGDSNLMGVFLENSQSNVISSTGDISIIGQGGQRVRNQQHWRLP